MGAGGRKTGRTLFCLYHGLTCSREQGPKEFFQNHLFLKGKESGRERERKEEDISLKRGFKIQFCIFHLQNTS